jgi:hypothetical protein
MDTIEDRHCCWAFLESSRFCIRPAQFDAGALPPWPSPEEEMSGTAKFTRFSTAASQLITQHFARSAEPLSLTVPSGYPDAPTLSVTVQRLERSIVGARHWLGVQRVEGRSVRWIRLYAHAVPLPRPAHAVPSSAPFTTSTVVESTGSAAVPVKEEQPQAPPSPATTRCGKRHRDTDDSTTNERASSGNKCAKQEALPLAAENEMTMQTEEPSTSSPDTTCPFCLEDLAESDFSSCEPTSSAPIPRTLDRPPVTAIRLPACGHAFHVACIERWFVDCHLACPTCRCSIDAVPRSGHHSTATPATTLAFRKWTAQFVDLGAQPDGTMQISLEPRALPGHADRATFTLHFHFPTFFADARHYSDPEIAGKCIRGTQRSYFLPACAIGFERLEGLIHAFRRRKAFGVGESLSHPELGLTVKHATIPWKSARAASSGNPFGYPDANYLTRLKIALDDVLPAQRPGEVLLSQ